MEAEVPGSNLLELRDVQIGFLSCPFALSHESI